MVRGLYTAGRAGGCSHPPRKLIIDGSRPGGRIDGVNGVPAIALTRHGREKVDEWPPAGPPATSFGARTTDDPTHGPCGPASLFQVPIGSLHRNGVARAWGSPSVHPTGQRGAHRCARLASTPVASIVIRRFNAQASRQVKTTNSHRASPPYQRPRLCQRADGAFPKGSDVPPRYYSTIPCLNPLRQRPLQHRKPRRAAVRDWDAKPQQPVHTHTRKRTTHEATDDEDDAAPRP